MATGLLLPTSPAQPIDLQPDMPTPSLADARTPPLIRPGANYGDDQKLLALHKQLKDEAWDHRFVFERGWWRLLLYILSRQWIYYDSLGGQWLDKRVAKWIPRPVTNKIAETLDAIRSVFQSVQLQVKCRPEGNDPRNVSTAAIADRLEAPLREDHDLANVQRESDFWLIALGNVFWHPWWDKRGGAGASLIPFETCLACGQVSAPDEIIDAGNRCPHCQQGQVFATAETGMPNVRGHGTTDVCSPFEIGLPPGYTKFQEIPYLYRTRWRTRQYYESKNPKLAKSLRFDKMPMERSLQLLRALSTTTDIGASPLSYALTGSVSTMSEGISEYELWLKPSRDYPEGLFLRIAGDSQPVIVRDTDESTPGPLPYHNHDGDPLFPWAHAGYTHVGGRIWARSPLETLLSKQDQINQLDSLVQLIVQRTANPVWLEPKGAEVNKFTGEPGLVVQYNPSIAAGNAKPERIPGENIPPSLITLRQSLINDLENMAGTSDILKGQRPPNIEAASALQMLIERAQSRFGPVLEERGRLYREWYGLALELERSFGAAERSWQVMGPNRGWTIETFKKADLSGSFTILIEDGSQTPKTNLGKRAAVEQLNQLGFISKDDAEQKYTIYRIFGATDLLPSLDNAVQSALREQDGFERWAGSPASSPLAPPMAFGMPPLGEEPGIGARTPAPDALAPGAAPEGPAGMMSPVVPGVTPAAPPAMALQPGPSLPAAMMPAPRASFAEPSPFVVQYWHNDLIHKAEHEKWANADNATKLFIDRPDLVPVFTQHLQAHDLSAVMKAQHQAMLQAGVAPPPAGAGAGMALRNSNRESLNPADVPRGSSERIQGRGPE